MSQSDPVLLYAHPTMDTLARSIVERCSGAGSSQPTLTPEISGKTPVSTDFTSHRETCLQDLYKSDVWILLSDCD